MTYLSGNELWKIVETGKGKPMHTMYERNVSTYFGSKYLGSHLNDYNDKQNKAQFKGYFSGRMSAVKKNSGDEEGRRFDNISISMLMDRNGKNGDLAKVIHADYNDHMNKKSIKTDEFKGFSVKHMMASSIDSNTRKTDDEKKEYKDDIDSWIGYFELSFFKSKKVTEENRKRQGKPRFELYKSEYNPETDQLEENRIKDVDVDNVHEILNCPFDYIAYFSANQVIGNKGSLKRKYIIKALTITKMYPMEKPTMPKQLKNKLKEQAKKEYYESIGMPIPGGNEEPEEEEEEESESESKEEESESKEEESESKEEKKEEELKDFLNDDATNAL